MSAHVSRADRGVALRPCGLSLALLNWLARCPFLSARDLTACLGRRDVGEVRGMLRTLSRQGLIAWLIPGGMALRRQRLYYLSDQGIRRTAALAGAPTGVFARRFGLGEAALLRRLCRLDHLVPARGLLIDLLQALREHDGGAFGLVDWQAWPVHCPSLWQGRRQRLVMDGRGVLAAAASGVGEPFVLLWDDGGDVSVAAWRRTLVALRQLRETGQSVWAGAATFPTILLVAATARREDDAHALLTEVAEAAGERPLAAWTVERRRLRAEGLLEARWSAVDGRERTLLCPTTHHQEPLYSQPAIIVALGGAPLALEPRHLEASTEQSHLMRGAFAARARTVGQPTGAGEVALLSLALTTRELRALAWIAVQPLLLSAQVAELARASPRQTQVTLQALLDYGLIVWDLPTRHDVLQQRRYFLTPQGLRLLAARAGLGPQDYLRYSGAIAGSVGDQMPASDTGSGRFPRKGLLQGRHLAWLQRYLEHTCAVQEVLLGFVRAARQTRGQGQEHELEVWRGEWAAAQHYPWQGAWRNVRPDAALVYHMGVRAHSFFLEVDRGTCTLGDLQAKLDAYADYAESGAWLRTYQSFPTILMVTTGEARLRNILALNERIATTRLCRPLPLLVTTTADLCHRGPLAGIWRESSREAARGLLATPLGRSLLP